MKNTDLIAVAKHEFKVGDLVVFNESHYFAGVYEIEGWSARGILDGEVFISGGRRVHESVLRHATPAEIKAGCRINGALTNEGAKVRVLGDSDDVVDISYHVSPSTRVSER